MPKSKSRHQWTPDLVTSSCWRGRAARRRHDDAHHGLIWLHRAGVAWMASFSTRNHLHRRRPRWLVYGQAAKFAVTSIQTNQHRILNYSYPFLVRVLRMRKGWTLSEDDKPADWIQGELRCASVSCPPPVLRRRLPRSIVAPHGWALLIAGSWRFRPPTALFQLYSRDINGVCDLCFRWERDWRRYGAGGAHC
jgi:hypothetical protein